MFITFLYSKVDNVFQWNAELFANLHHLSYWAYKSNDGTLQMLYVLHNPLYKFKTKKQSQCSVNGV